LTPDFMKPSSLFVRLSCAYSRLGQLHAAAGPKGPIWSSLTLTYAGEEAS